MKLTTRLAKLEADPAFEPLRCDVFIGVEESRTKTQSLIDQAEARVRAQHGVSGDYPVRTIAYFWGQRSDA